MRVMVMVTRRRRTPRRARCRAEELLGEDGEVQRGAGEGGRDARGRRAHAHVARASACGSRARKRTVIDGPFAETKELIAGLLDLAGEVDGGGGRVGSSAAPFRCRRRGDRSARSSSPRTSARSSRRSCARRRSGCAPRSSGSAGRERASMASHARGHRGGLAHRVRAADRRAGAPGSRRRASPRIWRRTRWSRRSSAGRRRASPTTPARG